ncbi:hypothetical protein NDU88_008143 [Pleurodeles waltl]|uniref:Uncharacterized protein n=1 Tax=Pleurodeles waltl TaxID=8319 RepID=A0AAV7P449_PLEWA|nr:hypothetical protein NDU88_008143 [Pleurodeles waltl]
MRVEHRAGGRKRRPAAASGDVWPGVELRKVQSGRAGVRPAAAPGGREERVDKLMSQISKGSVILEDTGAGASGP